MPTELLGGRYRLERELGRGGMATVWRAQDVRLDRPAALKVLDSAWQSDQVSLERLRREAQTVARLAHPNIVSVFDLGIDGDAAYLVMELVEGRSVADVLRAGGPLPVDRAVDIASQACAALAAAHDAGVVHRDVKPGNLLVCPSGLVKVCDFGIAFLQDATDRARLTRAGALVGTCEFMAPEQVTGAGPADSRSDLYSLGCVVYTMLAGSPPFVADSPIAVLDQQLHDPPVPLHERRPEVPSDLDRLVGELLAKDPADRPGHAGLVAGRLADILAEIPAAGIEPGPAVAASVPTELMAVGGPGVPTEPAGGPGGRHRPGSSAAVLPLAVLPRWVSDHSGVLIVVAALLAMTAGVALVAMGRSEPAAAPAPAPAPTGAPLPALAAPTGPSPSASPSATPVPSPLATVDPSPPDPGGPLDQVLSLVAALQAQVDAGRLDGDAADDLFNRLREVVRRLDKGHVVKASRKYDEAVRRIDELAREGKLTADGYHALPDLDQIADAILAADQ